MNTRLRIRLGVLATSVGLLASMAVSCTSAGVSEKQVVDIAQKNAVNILSRESTGAYLSSPYVFELQGHRTTDLLQGIGWVDIMYSRNGAFKRGGATAPVVAGKYVFVSLGALPPLDTLDKLLAEGGLSARLHRIVAVSKSKGQYAPDTLKYEELSFASFTILQVGEWPVIAVFERSSNSLSFESFPVGSLEDLERDDLVYTVGEFIDVPDVATAPNNVGASRATVLSVNVHPSGVPIATIEGAGPYCKQGSTTDGDAVFAINRKGEAEMVGIVALSCREKNPTRTYVLDLRSLLQLVEGAKWSSPALPGAG